MRVTGWTGMRKVRVKCPLCGQTSPSLAGRAKILKNPRKPSRHFWVKPLLDEIVNEIVSTKP
jgi:hypothetical protein